MLKHAVAWPRGLFDGVMFWCWGLMVLYVVLAPCRIGVKNEHDQETPRGERCLLLVVPEVCAVPWAAGGCGGRGKGMATVSCCQFLVCAGVD